MKSLAFALATLLAAQTASAQLVSERPEPNNSPATATFLPLGQQAFGSIDTSGTDADWYKITLTSRADLKAWTGAGRTHGSQVMFTKLTLVAGDGVTVLREWKGQDLVTGFYATFVIGNVAPGDYYLVVTPRTAQYSGDYSLDVVAGPIDSLMPYHNAASMEPDDPRMIGSANPTAFNSTNTGYIATGGFYDRFLFHPTVDYDFFALPLSGPCHVDFELVDTAEPGAAGTPVMHLCDAGYAPFHGSQPVYQDGVIERMSYDFPGAGLYYVAVHGLGQFDVGTYRLRIKGFLRERAEENDPRWPGGVPTITALNTVQVGYSSYGGDGLGGDNSGADYDWYQLDLQSPCTVTFDTLRDPAFFGFLFPVMLLCDSNYNVIAESFPMGAGEVVERLMHHFTQPGRYYIVVYGFFQSDVGTYSMRISGPSNHPATTHETPSNCPGSAGVPSLAALDGNTIPQSYPERPVLGSTYTLTGANLPANTPLFRLIGLLPRPVPFDLGNLGAPGCFVFVDPMSTELAFANATGHYHWALALPMNLQLIGLPLQQQLLAYDPTANALGLTTSSRVGSVCGTGH